MDTWDEPNGQLVEITNTINQMPNTTARLQALHLFIRGLLVNDPNDQVFVALAEAVKEIITLQLRDVRDTEQTHHEE